MNKKGSSRITEANPPIRAEPLPLEFPGLHDLDDQEIETVVRVLKRRSPFRYYSIDSPGEVSAFESEFADFLGIALAVNSGTATLRVALSAFGVGPGQEVIVPAYMWASVADAVVNLGAIPVLADIDNLLCGP
jgi:dTDP-4-amino-4,6-dideoxygalactose transaminase